MTVYITRPTLSLRYARSVPLATLDKELRSTASALGLSLFRE